MKWDRIYVMTIKNTKTYKKWNEEWQLTNECKWKRNIGLSFGKKWWGKSFYMPAAVYNEHIYSIVIYMREQQQHKKTRPSILSIHSNVRKKIQHFSFVHDVERSSCVDFG